MSANSMQEGMYTPRLKPQGPLRPALHILAARPLHRPFLRQGCLIQGFSCQIQHTCCETVTQTVFATGALVSAPSLPHSTYLLRDHFTDRFCDRGACSPPVRLGLLDFKYNPPPSSPPSPRTVVPRGRMAGAQWSPEAWHSKGAHTPDGLSLIHI